MEYLKIKDKMKALEQYFKENTAKTTEKPLSNPYVVLEHYNEMSLFEILKRSFISDESLEIEFWNENDGIECRISIEPLSQDLKHYINIKIAGTHYRKYRYCIDFNDWIKVLNNFVSTFVLDTIILNPTP